MSENKEIIANNQIRVGSVFLLIQCSRSAPSIEWHNYWKPFMQAALSKKMLNRWYYFHVSPPPLIWEEIHCLPHIASSLNDFSRVPGASHFKKQTQIYPPLNKQKLVGAFPMKNCAEFSKHEFLITSVFIASKARRYILSLPDIFSRRVQNFAWIQKIFF